MKDIRVLAGKDHILKRVMAFFLSWAMLFSTVPVQAFSEGDVSEPVAEMQEYQAEAGSEEDTSGGQNEDTSGLTQISEPADATEATEETQSAEPTDATEATEETQPTETTDVTEATEATESQTTETEDTTEATESTQATEPTDATETGEEESAEETTEETEPTEETQDEEPEELTNRMDQLALSLRDWWFASRGNAAPVRENKKVDFSGFTQDLNTSEWSGMTLRYDAVDVVEGDWFTVILPWQFADVRLRETFVIPEEIGCSLVKLEYGTAVTVRFSIAGAVSGELPLEFHLKPSENFDILLQRNENTKNEWTVVPPLAAPEETVPETTVPETSEPEETVPETTVPENDSPEDEGFEDEDFADEDFEDKDFADEDFDDEDFEDEDFDDEDFADEDFDDEDFEDEDFDDEDFEDEDFDDEDFEDEEFFGMLGSASWEMVAASGWTLRQGVQEDISLLSSGEADTFSIIGDITFNENINGIDWRSILRPLEFDQRIKLIATDVDGNEHTFYAQDSLPDDPFYMLLAHDGNGGGNFEITSVPKALTLENGTTVEVEKYQILVDTEEKCPYYESSIIEVRDMGATQDYSTLVLTVKTQTVKLAPEVVGDQTEQAFSTTVTFSNSNQLNTATHSLVRTLKPTNLQPSIIQVPVGLGFQVEQAEVSGYKWDLKYTVTTQIDGQSPVSSDPTEVAVGKIEEGTDVTVSTTNYMQNLTYTIQTQWVDNNDPSRPTLSESNFQLQYRIGDGEWLAVDDEFCQELGVSPTFDASAAERGVYTYRGLPSVDGNGNVISYQVLSDTPEGYTKSEEHEEGSRQTKFTYRKMVDFNVTITWRDSDNADGKRPNPVDLPLKLYRRAANGSYTEVTDENGNSVTLVVNDAGNQTWTVSANNLPRYNDQNQEYDYVVVQGSIGENDVVTQTPVDSYKTSYNNGTGNYANDIALCHNGGSITQCITGTAEFSATKVWKDVDSSERPKTIVTLWRYAVPASGDPGIDQMFQDGLAAQVVYRKAYYISEEDTYGYQDIILSYQLKGDTAEPIRFDGSNVDGLPSAFKLPAYDEQGRRYVYFVRETVGSEYYEVTYTAEDGTERAEGATNEGAITNTRREKASIYVNKVWQCPSNLPDINGTSVRLTILAPKNGAEGGYEELTVYSSAIGSYQELTGESKTNAQTLSGFSENIASLDLQFYVNIYDENGQPYDMTKAVIKEICVLKKSTDENGGETTEVVEMIAVAEDGSFTLEGNQYTAASQYVSNTTLDGGMKEFQYKETNTISGTRDYTLIKRWQGFTDEELAQFASISFELTRRSSRDGAKSEVVKTSDGQATWAIPYESDTEWQRLLAGLDKYDAQGYAYLYSASEAFVTDTDGNTVEKNWYAYTYHTEDSTTVTNYKGTDGGGSIVYIAKEWMDNGDVETRNKSQVFVRLYQKEDILNELSGREESAPESITLDQLTSGYIEAVISVESNTWFREVALPTGTSPTDYLALEYQVVTEGATSVTATYAVSQLLDAVDSESAYTVSGSVSNSLRRYQTVVESDTRGTMVYITNIRLGEASLEVTKKWYDEQNAGSTRPESVQFQVYQDGVVYQPGAQSGIGTITGTGAVWNPETGIITVSRDEEDNHDVSWSFCLDDLPLFSQTGVPHTYNVEEIGNAVQSGGESTNSSETTESDSDILLLAANEETQQKTSSVSQTGRSANYLSTKGETTVTQDENTPDCVHYQFSFDNTLFGTTAHSAHKTWQDRDTNGLDRPDLYLTLYRYLKSDAAANPEKPVEELDSYEKYSDCEDPIWTIDSPYHWRVETTGLPRYNESGQEYVYRFREALNNNGVTIYGIYQETAEYMVSGCAICDELEIPYVTPYDNFTNTLTGTMTVSGIKTWSGFDGYQIEEKDYPSVTIELYRSVDSTLDPLNKKDTDEDFRQWLEDGAIEKVDQVVLSYDAESGTYPVTYSFDNNGQGLPKFNGEGRRWYYTVREVISGEHADSLYTERFKNGTLTNVFLDDVNRRSIAVTKNWEGRENLTDQERQYPSVTFYLYRYVEGQSTENLQPLETVKINADQFQENGSYTYTFDDLLIYAPSGEPYRYFIKEAPIEGYSVSYTDEAYICDSQDEAIKVLTDNAQCDVISIPEDPFSSTASHLVAVETTNSYDQPGTIVISGRKYWDDYSNNPLLFSGRPDFITVILARYTANEAGQANAVSREEILRDPSGQKNTNAEGEQTAEPTASTEAGSAAPQITWEKTEGADYWTFTITNLERYAPNGMPYVYALTEVPVKGYEQSSQTLQVGENSERNVLTNSLGGTYYVRKNWMDGNNKYNLRPTEITVVLQRSNDGGTTWQNIPWDHFGTFDQATGKWTGLPSVTTGEVTITDAAGQTVTTAMDIVSIKLTADYVMTNTKGNSWEYTFTNLPLKDEDGNTWKYRCIETEINGIALDETKTVDGKNKLGAYTRSYTMQNDEKTVIQNKLESTSLHVTKVWDDQDNLYHSRPDSISFYLQMRGISGEGDPTDLSDWQYVMLDEGNRFTFTLGPDDWSTVLQDLPVATIGPDGETYYALYFRAVEITTEEKRVVGALNYADVTDYLTNYDPKIDYDENPLPDHYYNNALNRNESVITNELLLDEPTAKSISVTKNWKRQEGAHVTAVFELLYKTEDETTWHCYGGHTVPAADSGDWSAHTAGCLQQTLSSTETESGTITWTDLPKYDREGNELVYQVVEHPLPGYKIEGGFVEKDQNNTECYSFTNIELQSYSVQKKWQNTDYAERLTSGFTATFELQQKVADGEWTAVQDADTCTLTSTKSNDTTKQYTWTNLPKYTAAGDTITYRAVETLINGKQVVDDTNGSYIVTYEYDNGTTESGDVNPTDAPAFAGTKTVATNRMVYGFVNLSKAAAYLAPGVTEETVSGENGVTTVKKLAGVKFNIYAGNNTSAAAYVSNVVTDDNGNLIRNDDGTYGTEHKYLVSGTYTLMECSTNTGYSVWKNGVPFTVGTTGGNTDTGEHGTAWVSTSQILSIVLALKVEYKHPDATHTFSDGCTPIGSGGEDGEAYNLESRGIVRFTKTGPTDQTSLDTHAYATGESKAYFGVYTDEACSQQVAGMMADSDGFTMVLSTKAQYGTENKDAFLEMKNQAGIPYLREDSNGLLTLLSGDYYLKELVAPPGYKLDSTVRKAVVPTLENTDNDAEDLTDVYSNNLATVDGAVDYKWTNDENQLTLYKRDQFGRHVDLGSGYLELSVDSGTFLTGGSTIRLYQNVLRPAADSDGGDFADGKEPSITYNAEAGSWTIKGLFDIDKTYTLSEPKTSVPANNIQAKPLSFQMGADGKIVVTSTGAESKDDPLDADGTDYNHYFKSDSSNNVVVLRDVARYLTDVGLQKIDSTTSAPIENISFKLYKYESVDENDQPLNPTPVLADSIYLKTDSDGIIQLSLLDEEIDNLITGCALKHGLDVGKYYFQEIEQGASDTYRLLDEIFFEVIPNSSIETSENLEDYAKVIFKTSDDGPVSQTGEAHSATVENDPVTTVPKTLALTKVDYADDDIELSGAHFTLTYTSITNGDPGSQTNDQAKITYDCITDSSGTLYLCDANGVITDQQPDISKKGSYVLVETKAPDGIDGLQDSYMTRTENGSPVSMVTFSVNSDNQIVDVVCYSGSGELVACATTPESGEHTALKVIVKNEKTVVSIFKRNDVEGGTKTGNQKKLNGEPLSGAVLEIYEGVYDQSASQSCVEWWESKEDEQWQVTPGVLKENTIYTLHEATAPVGYLKAADIYFKLFGTTTRNGNVVSQLYVWTGEGTPASANEGSWQTTSSIQDAVLTMVDEAIIAPVDLQKVLGDADSGYQALEGALFEVSSLDDGTLLGTAVTSSSGHLQWQSIEDDAYAKGLIFNAGGKRVTLADANSVIGSTIILRQNSDGYQFTEIYAPDNAYNDGRSYRVMITDGNYLAYRTLSADGKPQYATNQYINIVDANAQADYSVAALTTRTEGTTFADGTHMAVNPPYLSTVTLHKYDADEEANQAPIPGTQFTLYHGTVSEGTWTKGAVVTDAYVSGESNPVTSGIFTTDANGDLSIEIHNKGFYILEETQAADGYDLVSNAANTFRFELIDDAAAAFGYGQTTALKPEQDTLGVPNERLKGSVTLLKQDADLADDGELNGVVYTLTRTDVPGIENYLLKTPMDVITGNVYTAYKDQNGQWQWSVDTGEPGEIQIVGLNWGSYELTEKMELNGYILSPAVHQFSVQADVLTISLEVSNHKNQVVLHKLGKLDNNQTKNLSGAVFEVHEGAVCSESCQAVSFYASASDQTKVTTVTSGADGLVTIYGLPTYTEGEIPTSDATKTYHLVETTAPKGYKLAEPVAFTIDRYGTVQILNQDVTEVVMEDEPIMLYIEKVGASSETKLTGAVFTLTDVCTGSCSHLLANDAASETGITVTDSSGKVMIPIERVIAGHTYKLVETKAPDGYECTAEITFSVDVHGKAELLSTTGGYQAATIDEEKTTFTISNEQISLSLLKVDYDSHAPLEGVVFALTPADNQSSFIDSFASTDSSIELVRDSQDKILRVNLTTDADGTVSIPLDLVKHDNSYVLTETDLGGNTSYRLAEGEADRQISFRVEKNGTITITQGNSMFAYGVKDGTTDQTALVVSNQQIELEIKKQDQATNAPLAGVTLKLSKQQEDNSWLEVAQWETDETGLKVFKGTDFTPGTYLLEEVSTPVGFNSIAGSLTFTIDQSGKITGGTIDTTPQTQLQSVVDNQENHLQAQNFTVTNPTDGQPGTIKLMVVNAKYSDLRITKKGSDDKLLGGVVFKLDYLDDSGNPIPGKAVTATTESEGESNGVAIFQSLPDGKYSLTELQTASGYNLLSVPLVIEINRNSGIYQVTSNGAVISGADGLTRDGDTILLTVINQKGLVLPATGTTTPQLPKAVLWITALLEGLVLYIYQMHGKRRKREAK